jgi:hypothetical protein
MPLKLQAVTSYMAFRNWCLLVTIVVASGCSGCSQSQQLADLRLSIDQLEVLVREQRSEYVRLHDPTNSNARPADEESLLEFVRTQVNPDDSALAHLDSDFDAAFAELLKTRPKDQCWIEISNGKLVFREWDKTKVSYKQTTLSMKDLNPERVNGSYDFVALYTTDNKRLIEVCSKQHDIARKGKLDKLTTNSAQLEFNSDASKKQIVEAFATLINIYGGKPDLLSR